MTSAFAAAWRAAEPDMDKTLGEPFLWLPRAKPAGDVNALAIPDPSRAGGSFTGRYTLDAIDERMESMQTLKGPSPCVNVASTTFPSGRPRVGDIFKRVATGELFRVESIADHDLGMTAFWLVRAKGPSA